jgi:transcriptional regulator with XRE-family HTH domain
MLTKFLMGSDLLASLGNAIRQVREDRQFSQEQISFQSGLDRSYISSVENGKRNVSIENLQRISGALGVSLTELIQLTEDRLQ